MRQYEKQFHEIIAWCFGASDKALYENLQSAG
jgi:hypothetical protein